MSVTRLVAALAAGAAAAAVAAARPADAKTYLLDRFEGDSFSKNWVQSSWKPEMGKWDVTSGDWFGDEASARGMRTSEDARFYAVSRKFDEAFTNEGKDLVVQFAVKNEKKGSSFCAGGYIKLLPSGTDQAKFGGDSPYHIMFGPDVCGYDVSRVHLIFHKDGENMLKKDDIKLEWADKDEFTHLYTLVVKPDNTYQVLFDGKVRSEGNLGEGGQWSKFAPKEIDDANAKKPSQEEWDERETILDEADVKPADWDDDAPQTIPDPNASQPADWNTEEDGEWSAPQIPNPKYRGVWKQKTKPNPAYKGKWTPPKVPNPAYTGKDYIYKDIGAVGFELWVVNSGTIFSNVIVTDSLEEANKLADETFHKHVQAEKDAKKAWDDKNKPADAAGDAAGDAAKDAADEDKDEL